MLSILIMNGPNLNMLGKRQPEIYGFATLDEIERICRARAESLGVNVDFFQSNLEGELVGAMQDASGRHDGIILNAAAYSHTSIALADAIKAVDIPVIEVHISNVYSRESFRHHSYITPVAVGSICGLGVDGYSLALEAMVSRLKRR